MEWATDWQRILIGRSARAFADGYVAVLLPVHLSLLGFEAFAVGAISTATLLGSALLTLALGSAAHRIRRRPALLAAALLMAATRFGFAVVHGFWPLLLIAFVGTLNPSGGDVSVFPPLEHTVLAHTVPDGSGRRCSRATASGRNARRGRRALRGSGRLVRAGRGAGHDDQRAVHPLWRLGS